MNDIVNLTKFNVYLKLMIDGIAGDAFSAATLPPIDLSGTKNNEEKAIKISRERYGKSRAEVEDKIARWSGIMTGSELIKIERKVADIPNESKKVFIAKPASPSVLAQKEERKDAETTEKKEESVVYNAVCDTCEEKITVPFKPDTSRPTFCRECLKDYQRMTAKARNEKKEGESLQPNRDWQKNIQEKTVHEPDLKPENMAFIPKEKPMTLSQISRIAPKKFKSARKKIEVNLAEVRKLINKNKQT